MTPDPAACIQARTSLWESEGVDGRGDGRWRGFAPGVGHLPQCLSQTRMTPQYQKNSPGFPSPWYTSRASMFLGSR